MKSSSRTIGCAWQWLAMAVCWLPRSRWLSTTILLCPTRRTRPINRPIQLHNKSCICNRRTRSWYVAYFANRFSRVLSMPNSWARDMEAPRIIHDIRSPCSIGLRTSSLHWYTTKLSVDVISIRFGVVGRMSKLHLYFSRPRCSARDSPPTTRSKATILSMVLLCDNGFGWDEFKSKYDTVNHTSCMCL